MSLNISVTQTKLLENKVNAVIFFVEQDFDFKKFHDLAKENCPHLEILMRDKKFVGKSGSVFVASVVANINHSYLVFVGLGKKNKKNIFNFESYRRSLGSLIRTLPQFNIKSIALELPEADLFGFDIEYVAKNTAIIINMANYVFDQLITDKTRISKLESDADIKIVVNRDIDKIKKAVDDGIVISNAVNQARTWVDLPANLLSPTDLANYAQKISIDHGLKCTIFSESEIIKMGMGGLAAVTKGSEEECKFVILEYKTEKTAPTICFVGKGITFDSGGLSIKPSGSMETMKEDMSGSAAVISAMSALAKLKPKVNIVAITPITENMPSGSATRPGDIITFYNGKTAEVKNTDAEGRLILADALSYAVKHYKPDFMIDLATLTGACAYALGPFFSGLFSEHDEFAVKVEEAAHLSGDYVWRLPLTDDYKIAVKSEVADLSNDSNRRYMAGGTTAACFLQNFVGEVPWVHLDIAGTAFNVPDISYYRNHSGTGAGVRLLVELAMNWK